MHPRIEGICTAGQASSGTGTTLRGSMNERPAPAVPATTACGFRGYNVTNLGRTAELLDVPRYAPTIERRLIEASQVASDLLSRRIDLLDRVRRQEETTLATYGDAV